MANNILEYTLTLNDQISGKLGAIGINIGLVTNRFAQLEAQGNAVNKVMGDLGNAADSLNAKLALLRNAKELVPAADIQRVKTYTTEIQKLEKEIANLNLTKLKSVAVNALSSLIPANSLETATKGKAKSSGTKKTTAKKTTAASVPGINIPSPIAAVMKGSGSLKDAGKAMLDFGTSQGKVVPNLKKLGETAIENSDKLQTLSGTFNKAATLSGKMQTLATNFSKASTLGDAYLLVVQGMDLFQTAASVATGLWSLATDGLAIAMQATGIPEVIIAIIALIAVIALIIYKVDGWGQTWDNVITFIKLGFQSFVEKFQLDWLLLQDGFMTGIEFIEKGWYKLKSLWDKKGAEEGLASLEKDRNNRAEEIAKATNKVNGIQKKMDGMKVIQLKVNDKGIGDMADDMKSKLGMSSKTPAKNPMAKQQAAAKKAGSTPKQDVRTKIGVPKTETKKRLGISKPKIAGVTDSGKKINAITTGAAGKSKTAATGANKNTAAVSAGGARNTQITINLGKLVENIVFHGGIKENSQALTKQVEDALLRVLHSAQSAG